jgi:hypothetical protein
VRYGVTVEEWNERRRPWTATWLGR